MDLIHDVICLDQIADKNRLMPLCEVSHHSTDFKPLEFQVTEQKTYYQCGCQKSGCQKTQNPPYCDSNHNK